jgi:DNA recombination protein RmuC
MAYYGMIAAVGLAAVAVLGIFFVVVKMRKLSSANAFAPLTERLDAIANSLESKLAGTRADLAQRLEGVKGDLRQEVADRLSTGFREVKEGVESQLSVGRMEQMTSLKTEIAGLALQTGDSLTAIRAEVDKKLGLIGDQVQQKLNQNIQSGIEQFQKVQEHLRSAEEQLRNVGEIGASINDLNSLLKMPHLRGRFGEEMLERLIQDFLPRSMYEFQAPAAPGVPGLVDVVIKFPARNLPIDAKFPREQVEALFEGRDGADVDAARVELVRVMKEQAKRISGYICPENGTTDMALMYLPSETLYMEAVLNREIVDYLNKLKIFPVSNNTLVVTLGSIQMVFKMYEFAKSHEAATEELKKAQKTFGYFEENFEKVGASLERAQDAFGTARRQLTTYSRRVTDLTGEAVPQIETPPNGDHVDD